MSKYELEYIATTYNVPAKVGQRLTFRGKHECKIVGARNAQLIVIDESGKKINIHPTWEVEYHE